MIESSNYYYHFPDVLENRIDFHYNHPKFNEIINKKILQSTIRFVTLGESIDVLKDSRNPQNDSELEFEYVDITNIDTIRGIPKPKTMFCKQATSSRMRQVMHSGTILVSTTRPTRNAIAIVPENLDNHICSTGFAVLKCKSELMTKFAFYALRSGISTYQFSKYCSGSGYPAINQDIDLKKIKIPKPTLDFQQQVISAIEMVELQAIDLENKSKKIRKEAEELLLLELGIELPKEEKIDYYLCWFDKLKNRLGHGNYHPSVKRLEDSLESAKYRIVPLGSLINLKQDSIELSKNPDDEFFYFGLENIEPNTGCLINVQKLTGQDILSKTNIFKKNQLMFSGLRPYLNKCFILEDYEEAIGSAELFVCESKEGISLRFLKWYLLSEITIRQTKWILSGASYPRLDESDFLNLKIVIPDDYDEQVKIFKAVGKKIKEATDKEHRAKRKWQEAKKLFEKNGV